MKILTETLSPPLVSWFRFAAYGLLLVPIALWRAGPGCFRPTRPLVQIGRGLMLAAGNTAFMYGVRHVDYANAIAILYIYPFIMIALSALVLGERVSGSAWIGVAGGFSGVLLVVRPDMSGLDPAAMFILFTGTMVALQMLFNRKLGVLSDPVVVSMGAIGSEGGVVVDGVREEPGRVAGWRLLFWPREPEELDLELEAVGVSMVWATEKPEGRGSP